MLVGHAILSASLATGALVYGRMPVRDWRTGATQDPDVPESFPGDEENPYGVPINASDGLSPVEARWRLLRSNCRWCRVTINLSIGALGSCLTAPLAWIVLGPYFGGGVPIVGALIFATVFCCVMVFWEDPTWAKSFSFARLAMAGRGLNPAALTSRNYIGASYSPAGERIGNGSDYIGFCVLTDDECRLHLHSGDIILRRADIRVLERGELMGDTMATVGIRLVKITWKAGDGGTECIYLLSRAGETAPAIKQATNRLYGRIEHWFAGQSKRDVPQCDPNLPP